MNHLFNDRPMYVELDRRSAEARSAIERMTAVELAKPDLAMRLRNQYELREITLLTANTEPREAPGGGIVIDVTIPFRGSSALLVCQPSQYTNNPPQGTVRRDAKPGPDGIETGTIVFSAHHPHQVDPEAVKRWRQEQLEKIERYLTWANQDAMGFYGRLANEVPTAIDARRAHLADVERLKHELA